MKRRVHTKESCRFNGATTNFSKRKIFYPRWRRYREKREVNRSKVVNARKVSSLSLSQWTVDEGDGFKDLICTLQEFKLPPKNPSFPQLIRGSHSYLLNKVATRCNTHYSGENGKHPILRKRHDESWRTKRYVVWRDKLLLVEWLGGQLLFRTYTLSVTLLSNLYRTKISMLPVKISIHYWKLNKSE